MKMYNRIGVLIADTNDISEFIRLVREKNKIKPAMNDNEIYLVEKGRMSNTVMESIDISGMKFIECRFNGITMRNVAATGVTFESCVFEDVAMARIMMNNLSMNGTTITDSNFTNSCLIGAKFDDSQINKTIFHGTVLPKSMFTNTPISQCRLDECSFRKADFICSPITDSVMYGTDFSLSNIDMGTCINCETDIYTTGIYSICPEEGSFIAWKKVRSSDSCDADDLIAKIMIPEDAKRISSSGNKCRCSKAKVLEFYYMDGSVADDIDTAYSIYDTSFEYRKGETVCPDRFSEDKDPCSHGIHFFMGRETAYEY